jgi:DDE superfamily endonuclease
MNVPACAMQVLSLFRSAFSTPTYQRFLVLALAAVLTTGRRTVTNLLRTVGFQAQGHMSSYHRVLSQRRWSTWVMARALIRFLLDHVVPSGPVLLAGDDTVTEHPGPQVFGKGRHRDAVRSSHSYTAYRWGHKWVVMSVLVKLPFARRPWALPVLVALYRPPEWDRLHGRRHRTPAHLARLLLARLVRWFPERHFIFVGDSGYGTSETARFCRQRQRHLTVVSKFYGDAALYEPPPPRTRRTIGRPRVKGQKLPSPQEEVAHSTRRTRLAVAWYGGTSRAIEIVTGTGHWYRIGEDLVAVRWVYVHDCTGTHRDEYFFTTDLSMCPQQVVECYTQRWSIETTFQECREHLKLESTKCYSQQTVLRFTPCLFGLYSLVVLFYLQLPDLLRLPIMVSWSGKSTTTFADMITCVRRAIWQQWCFQPSAKAEPFSKLPRSLQETILYALAPAA